MAIVRQMPQLYLRGSIAQITMKNLTEEERKKCDELTTYVGNHPEMKKHRWRVAKLYRETIGADYKDKEAADQEYMVAVWRGVVNLFYHRKYEFRCTACGAEEKQTKMLQWRRIDQQFIPCPQCQKMVIEDPKGSAFQKGDVVTKKAFDKACKMLDEEPTVSSTIEAIGGEYRYENPQEIIDDPEQLKKFFGKFVWSYFYQQIHENTRKEHNRTPVKVVGSADSVIVEEIISACNKLKVAYSFCPQLQPENGWWTIDLIGLRTPPEFTYELSTLLEKASFYRIPYRLLRNKIMLRESLHAPQIEALVIKPEHVMMIDNNSSVGEDDDAFTVTSISFRTVGGHKIEMDNHTETIECSDVMRAVYEALPEGDCRKVFQLYTQTGHVYEEFCQQFGHGDPKQAHLVKFLGTTPKLVKDHIQNIRHVCMMKQLTPAT